MSIFDQLMGLSGLYWCAECQGFHPPDYSTFRGRYASPFPPQRGGDYGGYGGFPPPLPPKRAPFPTQTLPPRHPPPMPTRFRDPWGGEDPYEGAIEVAGPDDARFPTRAHPTTPISRRPPPSAPAPAPVRRPVCTRTSDTDQHHGGYPDRFPGSSGGGSRSGPVTGRGIEGRGAISGGNDHVYDDGLNTPAIPKLPPVRQGKRIKPKNPNETFMNAHLLWNSKTHPYAPGYPKILSTGPVPVEEMTAEEQSAKAFVMTCINILPWNECMEDMYSLAMERKVPEKLIAHIKYLMAAVVPHCQCGGEMAPGDYCKARRCIDWMAEIGEVIGAAYVWTQGFQKARGHSRETGWWRAEGAGFAEGPGFNPGMI